MRNIKRFLILASVLFAPLGWTWSASTDSITVAITPNAYYAVEIDTANVVLDMGTLSLGASTQTVRPSTVSIQSTFATTDLKIQGSISSAGTAWAFDSNTATLEPDSVAVWATFTSIARSSVPTQTADYFSGTVPGASDSDVVDGTSRFVGSSASQLTTNLFENNSDFDAKNMDALAPEPYPAAKSHLWLYFRLPNATTSTTSQNISFTITAVAPD